MKKVRKQRHGLIMRWREPDHPLPRRAIRSARRRERMWHEMPAPRDSDRDGPFDFCAAMQALVMDIAIRCPDFRHLDVPRILATVTQARGNGSHGLQARVTPLRFANGSLTRKRRGVPYQIQRYFLNDHEYLYLLTFCLPRYLELDFDQKMVTLFHELYHIGPAFDGDLRRHGGRCHVHTHSQREYDDHVAHYAREYLASKPDPALHAFLRLDFAQLEQRHGAVTGIVVPRPLMIPLVGPHAPVNVVSQQNLFNADAE